MARPVLGFALGALLLTLGSLGLVSDAPLERVAVRWLGDPTLDCALDAGGVPHVGEIMTVDREGQGQIVSYEYVHDDHLYVGYQRTPSGGFGFRPFDVVDLQLLPAAPGTSRLAGTWLHPRSRMVDLYRSSRWLRRAVSACLLLAALGVLTLAGRARAR